MLRRSLPLLLLVLTASPSPADDAAGDPDLESVLALFARAQGSTETLQARFEERKDLSLFKEPVVQTGRFSHTKPDLYLWEDEAPTTKKILLNSEVLLAYYPDLNRAEEVNVRRWSQRIRRYLDVGTDPEALRADYDIRLAEEENDLPGTVLLVLKPKKRRVKSRLEELRIWLDPDIGQSRRITYLEPNGDRTTFHFHDIRVNEDIPASLYDIDLPGDVKMGDTFTAFSGR